METTEFLILLLFISGTIILLILKRENKLLKIIRFLGSDSRETLLPAFLSDIGIDNLEKFEDIFLKKYIKQYNLNYVETFPEELTRLMRHYRRLQKEPKKIRAQVERVFFKALSTNSGSLAFILYELELRELAGNKEGQELKKFILDNIKDDITEIIFKLEYYNREKMKNLISELTKKSPI